MLFHRFDPITNLYIDSIESDEQPENSISGHLPEATEFYTFALVDGALISVLKPKYDIVGQEIVKKEEALTSEERQAKANSNLEIIRALRQPLLIEADYMINKLEDDEEDTSAWRQYRKALRACTDSYKKVDGNAKLICETLVTEEFEFPAKPE